MSHVDLGFSQECEPWQVESYLFPSKIGGKPAWLDLENLPSPEKLQCDSCQQPTIFLCQIYAPYEDDDNNFHRTIFVFICRDPKCCVRNSSSGIKIFRSCLRRQNKFYSYDPPDERKDPDFSLAKWTKLCNVCGCASEKHCSKCKKVAYCSKNHQIVDWKEGHKNECENGVTNRLSKQLFAEYEIVIEPEEFAENTVDEKEEMDKFKQLEREGKTGTMSDVPDNDIEKYAAFDNDKVFARFKKRIGNNPDQILRYERGGKPLWIANDPTPGDIPSCEHCGAPRQYEFQIMPQLWAVLHEHELDVGVIAVYTCSKSCTVVDNYKTEYAFKQDIAINS